MAESPPPRKFWQTRRFALGASAGVIVGGVALAIGPLAGWMVDFGAEGRRVWRLGNLRIDGVSGSWLGDLTARRIAIEDEEGVWAEAFDVSLDWRPLDLLGGSVRIDDAVARRVSILRAPVLLERRPPGDSSFNVRLDRLRVDDLAIEEAVFGAGGQFTADFSLAYIDKTIEAFDLALLREDSDADRATAHYDSSDYALSIDVVSDPGGVIASALGAGEQGLTLTARGEGEMANGAARLDADIGDSALLDGVLRWTQSEWTLEGQSRLDVLPLTQTIARRLGDTVTLAATGARPGRFTAHAETPYLALDIDGVLDEDLALAEPARLVAQTSRLSALAYESPFELGPARLEGTLTRDDQRTTIGGQLDARDMEILGRNARLTGPIRAQLTPRQFELTADLAAPRDAPALFANALLEAELDYNRTSGRFELARANLDGDAIAADARGWTNRGAGQFSGAWRIKQMQAFARDLRGGASGRWRASAATEDEARVWSIAVDGEGANLSGRPDIVPQLLGRSPNFNGLFRIERGGVTVSHARLDAPKLRAGASGRIVGGAADLRLEASARGPLEIGTARIVGNVDATGRMTGRLARPTLTMQAQFASIVASGVEITQPLVNFTLAPRGDDYAGDVRLEGAVQGQPLTAQSPIVISDGSVAFPDLIAQAGGLEATGSVALSEAGPRADLAVNGSIAGLVPGASGKVMGDVALTPEIITVDVQIADARSGDLRIRAATLTASGPYSAIEARFSLRGRANQAPLSFAGAGVISLEDGVSARIEGEGALADSEIATRTPLVYAQRGEERSADFDLTIDGGSLRGQWRERGQALSGSAVIDGAPLAPIAAIIGERATGSMAGQLDLRSEGAGLAGSADVNFIDARFAGRQRGALDAHVVATLTPARLQATVDARSDEGLEARLEADAPVVTDSAPILIAIAPERRGRATWSIDGPVEALWSAARLHDQALEGDVSGEGDLEFGAGYLAGDGRIEIADGRFEDRITGVKLEDLQAAVVVRNDGVAIERFTATDGGNGRMTATGGSANAQEGRIEVTLRDFRFVDRPDAEASGSGDLVLAWEGLDSTLSGALQIAEANVSLAARPDASIPQLDVIEINRPGFEDETEAEEEAANQRGFRTDLNIDIDAPGRIFTRGRGIEAEWRLDLTVGGTLADPQINGTATAVRGTIALSGQPFVIDEGSIRLRGAPENAEIDLTAVRTTTDLTATMHLTGVVTDPEISFTSDPALPEDEILPQVLFGRSEGDLTALEAAQLASSLAALSGQASFNLVDAARAAVGLDRFAVREDENGGVLVAGGVYLTSDVYVEVARTGLGQAQTRVEWTIRPQLVLITSFLPNGDQRVSIRWRRETD